ncbi:MAG TPA: UrcA family protein [Novosphingobium sp.]|nr:UrcA family protein [Novosphingobium sp.]
MTRHLIINTLAMLALAYPSVAALADETYDGDNIIVSSPNVQVTGRSMIGAPIRLYTTSVRINVRDLDLRSEPGWDALGQRVRTASRVACDMLDRMVLFTDGSDSGECRNDAARSAMRVARELRTSPTAVAALIFRVGKG